MEYVIVEFPGRREVLVDGISYGDNREQDQRYRILRVPEGLRRFRFRGPEDYVPLWQTVEVKDTDAVAPMHVVFEKKA
jgi:hypothetical protein